MISQVVTGERTRPPVLPKKLDIDALIEQTMPASSAGLLRLMEILRNDSAPRGDLIRGIHYDPVLTARILRLANSPIYSFERDIMLVDMALTAIGTQAIYGIVIIELASRTFNAGQIRTALSRRIWEHSVAVAVLTKKISETLELRGAEESFICGLLHDFGKYILVNYNEEEYKEILRIDDEIEMLKTEYEHFGYNHAEIGSLVARRWNLPDDVCFLILNHHAPAQAGPQRFVQYVVDAADTLASSCGYGTREKTAAKPHLSESAMKLGLTEKILEKMWDKNKGEIAEVIRSFG